MFILAIWLTKDIFDTIHPLLELNDRGDFSYFKKNNYSGAHSCLK
jgi:hypothetical protein